jgi:hypothetical protein
MRARRGSLVAGLALSAALAIGLITPSAFGVDGPVDHGPGKAGSTAGEVQGLAEGDATAQDLVGGPIVIMGIDAEDGGIGGHGPISNYVDVMNSIIANASNGGTGLLVIGGGKSATDDVTEFWDAVASGAGIPVTYVNGAANIATQSFAGFKVVGVASGDGETSSGGLTATESEALAGRQADIATHVNGGGGLLVFAQDFADDTASAYGFLGGIGAFTFVTELGYSEIAPTPEGTAIGITDALDISAWHDVYLTYPAFLNVLAVADDSSDEDSFGKVAALGGANVFIGERPVAAPEPEAAPPVVIAPRFTG